MKGVLLIAFSVLASAIYIHGQVTTGAIVGFVTDPHGAALSGATLTVTNLGTGYTQATAAGDNGSYSALLLPPGTYSVTAEKSGFRTSTKSGIILAVSQTARADFSMLVGAVSQTVTVTDTAVNVDTHSAQLTNTVTQQQLLELPLAGEHVLTAVNTTPGVIPAVQTYGVNTTPHFNTFGNADPQAAGGRQDQVDFQFDGSHSRSDWYGSSTLLPNAESVQEVQVIRGNFSAEYGLSAAMVINVVTKSGANQFHGSAYDNFGNDALDSREFDAATKPQVRYNQFGATLGGPVRIPWLYNGRDKTFFFFGYQGIRQPSAQVISGGVPPTAQQKAGVFSTTIVDPNTGAPFPNNTIPTSRYDPVAAAILPLFPAANFGNQFRENVYNPQTSNQVSARIDQRFGDKSRLFGRFFYDDESLSNTLPGSSLPLPGWGYQSQFDKDWNASLGYTQIIRPTLIDQLEFSYNNNNEVVSESGPFLDVSQLPFQNWNPGGPLPPPYLYINGYGFTAAANPDLLGDISYQASDSLSWIHGRNTTKFGFAFMHYTSPNSTYYGGRDDGEFTFDGSFSGDSFADFLLGLPSELTRYSQPPVTLNAEDYEAFVQDDVVLNRRLALNFGLRYSILTPFKSNNDLMGTFVAGQQLTVIPSAPTGLVYVGDKGIPNGIYRTHYKDFSPRFGFAIDPTGRGDISIRGGFGIFYNFPTLSAPYDSTYEAPYGVGEDITPLSLSNPFEGIANPFPYTFDPKNVTFTLPIYNYVVMQPNMQSPYVESWNLTLQKRVKSVLFEASYVGSGGHHLYAMTIKNSAVYIPGNNAQGQPNSTLYNEPDRVPYLPGQIGWFGYYGSFAYSNYQALETSIRGNVTKNLILTGAWTYGHSIDDASSTVDSYEQVSNPNDPKTWRGNSDFDFRHIGTVSAVWSLPKLTGMAEAGRAVLGGWTLSTLFSAQTGGFTTILSGQDRSLSGVGQDRADQIAPGCQSNAQTRLDQAADWWNQSNFTLNEIGTFGTAGRNTCQAPGGWVDDLSAGKTFSFPEGVTAHLQGDAYNAFNHTRLGDCSYRASCHIDNSLSDSTFGLVQRSRSGRTVQVGLHIRF